MTSRLHAYTVRHTVRTVAVIVGSLIVIAGIAYGIVRAFTLQTIVVDGQGISLEIDRSKLGNNLVFLQTSRLTRDILSNYPMLDRVEFEKKLPGTLIVHLVRRQPIARLRSGNNLYAVDRTGIVLDNATPGMTYPIVQFDIGALEIGHKVTDPRVHAALTFLNGLSANPGITGFSNADGTYILAIMGDTNIFLPQSGDLGGKASTLQTIIEGFRIKGTLPTVIDLRFEKPIVTN